MTTSGVAERGLLRLREARGSMGHERTSELDALLAEQQRYYSARAPEYDHWWHRQGRYDLGPEGNRCWFRELAEARAALDAAPLGGEVLELAGGTGLWTEWLAARATEITVLDGSTEMLARNVARLSRAGLRERVRYREVDLFGWRPSQAYDAVFCGFWLSHVPAALLDGFLEAVALALRPGGWLGAVDSRPDGGWRRQQGTQRLGPEVESRQIDDGRTFQVVKRYDSPIELEQRLARCGIQAQVRTTATHFLYAIGRRRASAP